MLCSGLPIFICSCSFAYGLIQNTGNCYLVPYSKVSYCSSKIICSESKILLDIHPWMGSLYLHSSLSCCLRMKSLAFHLSANKSNNYLVCTLNHSLYHILPDCFSSLIDHTFWLHYCQVFRHTLPRQTLSFEFRSAACCFLRNQNFGSLVLWIHYSELRHILKSLTYKGHCFRLLYLHSSVKIWWHCLIY